MGLAHQPSVLWREGMFLFPQHLQAFSRELLSALKTAGGLGTVGDWGALELDVDEDALEEDAFAIRRAKIVFRDGSVGCFPESAVVEKREFGEHFKASYLDVYLGVPTAQEGVPQIGGGDSDEEGVGRLFRYRVRRDEVLDENDRGARREMEFRQLQGHLFFGDEDRSGFDSVHIARLARVGRPKARSVLAKDFITPVLCCGASPALSEALQAVAQQARNQSRDLAARMPDLTRLSSVERGADISGLVKLMAVNQCVALLEQASAQDALHPFLAHQALVQAAGNLAVFGKDRVVPELPPYDHADLDGSFGPALAAVGDLLAAEVEAPYDTTPFVPDPVRHGLYKVALPGEWVAQHGVYHIAVEIAEAADTVRDMVSSGVKLVPEGEIERVLQGVMPGIQLNHERVPPLSFPKRDTLHYFEVETEGEGREAWLEVLDSRAAVILSALGSPDHVSFHVYVEFPD